MPKYYAGKGCTCGAYGESECACGVDWTDPKIYELENEIAMLKALLKNNTCKIDCIHYGKTHPCVLCTRDICNKDYYEKGKMNG